MSFPVCREEIFWQPLIAPEARKERSCQSFSASHIGPRADCPFHRPAFFRPGVRVTEAPSTGSYILRLDLSSTLIRHENGAFRKRLSHDNHVIFVKKNSNLTSDCYVFKLIRLVLAENFSRGRFQRATSVF